MDNTGIVRLYYAKSLPPRAVGVAQITTPFATPESLTGIDNAVYNPGALTFSPLPTGAAVDAAVIGNTVLISGSVQWAVLNQFFEITDQVDTSGTPYYYRHPLPSTSTTVSIVDSNGTAITKGWILGTGEILHDLDGGVYWVSFYDGQVFRTQLLQYASIWVRSANTGSRQYTFNQVGLVTLPDTGTYRVRFSKTNGYQVLPPYTVPSGDPWYVRVRFNLNPIPGDWALQPFQPQRPFRLATWVPGTVVAGNLIQLDRPGAWFDPTVRQYPDLLIYDQNLNLKYALDGRPVTLEQPANKGFLFPWRTSQIVDMDPVHTRVQVNIDLDPTDRVFGFYAYQELDVLFQAIDINPVTNPAVKNKIIEFYWADRGNDIPPRD